MRKHKKKILVGAAAVCVAALGVATLAFTATAAAAPEPAAYREYTAKQGNITVGVEGVGVVRLDSAAHGFSLDGKLDEILVAPGQQVGQGQPLARLDEDDLARRRKELKAQYDKLLLQLEQQKLAQEKTGAGANRTQQETANSLQAARDSFKIKQDALNGQIGGANAQAAALQTEIDALQAELNALNAALESETDDAKRTEGEAKRAALEKQIAEKTAAKQAAAAQRAQAQTELNTLTTTFSAEEQRLTDQLLGGAETQGFADKDAALQQKTLHIEIGLAKDKLDALDAFVKDPVLYASQGGTVLEITAKPGDAVVSGAPILTLGTGGNSLLEVQVPQGDIAKIELGQTAEIFLEAYPDTTFTGTVERIALKGENAGGDVNYKVHVKMHGDTSTVYDGMTGEVTFLLKQKKDVLTLSNKAIQNADGKQTVLRRTPEGKVETVEITTGFSDGRVSEIKSGLAHGDIILVER